MGQKRPGWAAIVIAVTAAVASILTAVLDEGQEAEVARNARIVASALEEASAQYPDLDWPPVATEAAGVLIDKLGDDEVEPPGDPPEEATTVAPEPPMDDEAESADADVGVETPPTQTDPTKTIEDN